MSVVSDVRDLYGTLESTWSRGQAHILTHVLAGVVIFFWCGVTFPSVPMPHFDPDRITQDPWFKLAKDTGLIYVALVIPVIVISAYVAFLSILGQTFLTLFSFAFFPNRQFRFQGLSDGDLEPLALMLNKDDEFTLDALWEPAYMLSKKYESSKPETWSGFQKYLGSITRNSGQYLGDFSVFLLVWFAIFFLWPQASWVAENAKHFWWVTLVLLVLIWLSWVRVSRAISASPRLLLQVVAMMVRTDPEFASLLQVPNERRDRVRERLKNLLHEERNREQRKGSFLRLISHWLGIPSKEGTYIDQHSLGPTAGLYERGLQLSEYGGRLANRPTFADLIAYLYYRAYNRISGIITPIWVILRYWARGVP